MKPLAWIKIRSADLLTDMACLTPAERGVYITVIACVVHQGGGPLRLRPAHAAGIGLAFEELREIVDRLAWLGLLSKRRGAYAVPSLDGRTVANRRANE